MLLSLGNCSEIPVDMIVSYNDSRTASQIHANRTNHHDGNKRYRKLVEGRKVDYVNSKRLDKPLVSLDIIREWRGQRPPGRFLKFDEKKEVWLDVGDKKAREKTSQALREKAPLLRKQQEEQMMELTDTGSNVEYSIGSPVGSAEVRKN